MSADRHLVLEIVEAQLLYIGHADTKHRHVHIVANRVHPETGVAWKASHDYRTIEQSLRRQSEAHGLDFVPGRHNDPDKFRDKPRKARDPEVQRQRTIPGAFLAKRWSRDHVKKNRSALADKMANAGSWQELDESLFLLDNEFKDVDVKEGVGERPNLWGRAQLGAGEAEIQLAVWEKESRYQVNPHITKYLTGSTQYPLEKATPAAAPAAKPRKKSGERDGR